jgi:hypothetical protein
LIMSGESSCIHLEVCRFQRCNEPCDYYHPYQNEQLTENQKRTKIIRQGVHDARIAMSERDKVLDVDTIGTLLNIVEKDCDRLTVMERQAYRKAKLYERELRQQAGEP